MTGQPPDLAAQLHVAQVKNRFFMEENQRLRDRVHQAVDECQRRYAPDLSELSRRRWMAVWAQEELDKYWSGQYSHVSSLGHTIVENLIGRIKDLEAEVASSQVPHDVLDMS